MTCSSSRPAAVRKLSSWERGFDTRAFRPRWPAGAQIWELDQAKVLDSKEEVLAGVKDQLGMYAAYRRS
jgi:Leucine carboxyl methyltransferase